MHKTVVILCKSCSQAFRKKNNPKYFMPAILTQKYLQMNDFNLGKVLFPSNKKKKTPAKNHLHSNKFKIKDFFSFNLKII